MTCPKCGWVFGTKTDDGLEIIHTINGIECLDRRLDQALTLHDKFRTENEWLVKALDDVADIVRKTQVRHDHGNGLTSKRRPVNAIEDIRVIARAALDAEKGKKVLS